MVIEVQLDLKSHSKRLTEVKQLLSQSAVTVQADKWIVTFSDPNDPVLEQVLKLLRTVKSTRLFKDRKLFNWSGIDSFRIAKTLLPSQTQVIQELEEMNDTIVYFSEKRGASISQKKPRPASYFLWRKDNQATVRKNVIVGLQLFGVSSIPESLGQLTELECLCVLDAPELASLPQSIGALQSLKFLFINSLGERGPSYYRPSQDARAGFKRAEKLTTLPESIGDLRCLEEIDIYGTNISALPESLGHLENLCILYLDYNTLTTLPKSVGNLKQLTHLSVKENRLKALPQSLVELTNLRYLDLSKNRIKTLPGFHFILFPHLYVAIGGNPAATSLDAVRELGIPAADVVVCPKCGTLVSEANVRHILDIWKGCSTEYYTCPCGEEIHINIEVPVPDDRSETHYHDPPCGCEQCRDEYPEYYKELEAEKKLDEEEKKRHYEAGIYTDRIRDRSAQVKGKPEQQHLDKWLKRTD